MDCKDKIDTTIVALVGCHKRIEYTILKENLEKIKIASSALSFNEFIKVLSSMSISINEIDTQISKLAEVTASIKDDMIHSKTIYKQNKFKKQGYRSNKYEKRHYLKSKW